MQKILRVTKKIIFLGRLILKRPQYLIIFLKILLSNNSIDAFLRLRFIIFSEYERHKFLNFKVKYKYKNELDKKILNETIKSDSNETLTIIIPLNNKLNEYINETLASISNQYYEDWIIYIINFNDIDLEENNFIYKKQSKFKNINVVSVSNTVKKDKLLFTVIHDIKTNYVIVIEPGQEFTRDALYQIVKKINSSKEEPDLIYYDEDIIKGNNKFTSPLLKPGFSPDLLLCTNYIGNSFVIRTDLLKSIETFKYDNIHSDSYDLLLKIIEKNIVVSHIPRVLIHNIPYERKYDNVDNIVHEEKWNKQSLVDYLERNNIKGDVLSGKIPLTYRVKRHITNNPLISIIIPFRDMPDLLKLCLDSIIIKSTYDNYEIIAISNNSESYETKNLIEEFSSKFNFIRFIDFNKSFNFSKINNYGVSLAKGDHIVLLNNDIEIITPNWIESLLEHSQRSEVGAVGAKLYYPDDTIQHAGIIIFPSPNNDIIAKHFHQHFPGNSAGYLNRLQIIQNFSAVTAACMMVKKSLYEKVGGLNENDLKVAFNDVDFCIRLMKKGYWNIFTPFCEAYHHESVSRGYEITIEKRKRIILEGEYIKKQHGDFFLPYDPFYHPSLNMY